MARFINSKRRIFGVFLFARGVKCYNVRDNRKTNRHDAGCIPSKVL